MHTYSKRFLVLLWATMVLLLAGCGSHGELTIEFPKIGSADTAVLMTKHATVVIDTGESGDGEAILEILSDHHRKTVDLLVISHYDKDHVGGAAEVLSGCTVKRVIGSTSPKVSDETADYYSALRDQGLTEEVPASPLTLELDGMSLTILPPERSEYATEQSNNSSTAAIVQYGSTALFFAGDAMDERMDELLPELEGHTFDLIKLPHHGRDLDTTALLLPHVQSGGSAVITSSKKEPENDQVLSLLDQNGVAAYLTREGSVRATSDGKTMTIEQE